MQFSIRLESKYERLDMTQEWYPEIKDWSTIDEAKARLLSEEGEIYFDCLVKTNEISNTKALILFGILITITTGLSGFIISKANTSDYIFGLTTVFASSTWICFTYALYRTLITLIMPQKMPAPGNEPQFLLTNELMSLSIEKLLIGQSIRCQRQISRLIEVNNRIAVQMRRNLIIAAAAPFIGVGTTIIYLIAFLLV